MNEIDYEKLADNYRSMINLLEYDAMRGPGKAKMNSQHLHSLYYLLERAEKKVSIPAPKKEAK